MMRKIFCVLAALTGTGMVWTSLTTAQAASPPSILPTGSVDSCPLSKTEMQGWFADNTITANGKVQPANSPQFPLDNTNCDFFKWSAQMFLWLTSPALLKDSSAMTYVFDADGFYDISPEDANQTRRFLKNDTAVDNFLIRVNKQDDDLPTEIGETGQAGGGGILISQQNSLVYYGIHTNTFYGAFLTGQKAGILPQKTFPTNEPDRAAVVAYALANDLYVADSRALTIELKTSWVDARTVTDPDSYIQVTATVPKYNKNNPAKWTLDGSETRTLALVGMHVVGSVRGHAEMIWATYEHQNNSPNNSFYYQTAPDQVSNVPFNPAATGYVFYAPDTAPDALNTESAHVDQNGDIVLTSPATSIVPTSVMRTNPWGNTGNDASSAEVNSQIISLNTNVLNNLATGDLRANYVQIGAVWTQNGNIPNSPPPQNTAPEKGSPRLANTTMETYFQGSGDGSCFLCHNAGGNAAPEASFGKNELSHIYFNLIPLK